MPKVSVVIPTYNYARFLGQSLESVLNQTYKDFEIIIIDDGSTDNTHELVSSYGDSRIRYVFQKNRGLARSRNLGIEIAQGELIAFLDSDDVWLSQKLNRQVTAFEKNVHLGMVFGQSELIDEKGDLLVGRGFMPAENLPFPTLYENLLGRNLIPGPSSVILTKECLMKVGGFDHACGGVADLDMWRRVAREYACYEVPEILTQIRVHGGSMTYSRRAYMAEGMIACILRAAAEVGPDDRYQPALKFAQQRLYTHASWYFLEDAVHDFQVKAVESEMANSEKALACWINIPGRSLSRANISQQFDEIVESQCRFFIGDNKNVRLALDGVDVISRALQKKGYFDPKEERKYRNRGYSLVLLYASQQSGLSDPWQARSYAWRAIFFEPKLIVNRKWIKVFLGKKITGQIIRLYKR